MKLAEIIAAYNLLAVELGWKTRKSFKNKTEALIALDNAQDEKENRTESTLEETPFREDFPKPKLSPNTIPEITAKVSDDLAALYGYPAQNDLIARGVENFQLVSSIVSRQEALDEGYSLYWNGEACEHGHISPRYAVDGKCKTCYQEYRKKVRAANDVSRDK